MLTKIFLFYKCQIPEFYADPTKIEKELGWKAIKNLQDMCRDSWKFAKNQAKI